MQRRYVTVDVFTDRAFGGNPLAWCSMPAGCRRRRCQAIALEFNYSETTFVLPPQNPANDAQVRIFTVGYEIPFAGHPNVGTAFVLATLATKPPSRLLSRRRPGWCGRNSHGARKCGGRRTDRAAAAESGCRRSAWSRRRCVCRSLPVK